LGKTTLAAGLATVLAKQFDTLLIDTDPQLSFQVWMQLVPEKHQPPFRWTADRPNLDLRKLEKTVEQLVVDTGPGHAKLTARAVAAADVCLIPFSGGLDVPHVIGHAQVVAGTPAFYVRSKVPQGENTQAAKAAAAIERITGLKVLDNSVPEWKRIRNLVSTGRSIPKSGPTYDIFESILLEVNDRLAAGEGHPNAK